ncbi:pentatricopeptide repeat-containing protein [Tanacetum coccineum]|uniref:Pentatricopeptide repeat-containing protein n=1 Tax=Tanacetum coccineum TaxID=301880 RepID=A0ABQ4YTE9_9ASTR
MDTLSLVSKYLNGMEDLLDDGDSLEARKLTVGKSKEELGLFEVLDHKSVIVKEGSHRVVVFKNAPPRAYNKPFTRFFLPCDMDGQGAWDAELDMADSFNYMTFKGKLTDLDSLKCLMAKALLMGRARLSSDDYGEEAKMRIMEHGLPKKMCDLVDFVLPMKVNETDEMSALVDTGECVSVLPFCLFRNLGLGDPKPYNSYLTMVDNTQTKAITCGVVIDMGCGTLCLDDGVIRHTYFPKPRAKAYLDNFAREEEDDWSSSFEVGRDEDGNPKYGPVAPSFLDIEDDMERALAMEAYFNPFKNIIVFKKLIDFLCSLLFQLKNTDLGSEGYGTYKKVEGDGDWHAKFEVTTPSGRKFTRVFKTKNTDMKLSENFTSEDILKFDPRLSNSRVGVLAHLPACTSLVIAYARAGRYLSSVAVFREVFNKDVVVWNAMMTCAVENGELLDATGVFMQMLRERVVLDSVTLVIVVSNRLACLQCVHSLGLKFGLLSGTDLCNALINVYAKCGELGLSENMFVETEVKDTVSWNSMISGCLSNDRPDKSLWYFKKMVLCGVQLDNVGLSCAIAASTCLQDLDIGKVLHGFGLKNEYSEGTHVSVLNALVSLYSKCGDIDDAVKVFRSISAKDLVSWNTMINGFASYGMIPEAFSLLRQMQVRGSVQPDTVTVLAVLSLCAESMFLREGKSIHGFVIRRFFGLDVSVINSLMNMYSKCNRIDKAESLFVSLHDKDLVSWNTMISGYAQNGKPTFAQNMFKKLMYECLECSLSTVLAVFSSCDSRESLKFGESLHSWAMKLGFSNSILTVNSLIFMYTNCGHLRASFALLQSVSRDADVACWNAMIAGCTQNGYFLEALETFKFMRREAYAKHDLVTLVNVVSACGNLELVFNGKMVHGLAVKTLVDDDVRVRNALITMYGRFGDVDHAMLVFDSCHNRNLCSWNCIISALAQNKEAQTALHLFQNLEFEPDEITNSTILSACSQIGSIRNGKQIHGHVLRSNFHTNCYIVAALIDMYSNCGRLDMSIHIFNSLQEKNIATWNSMISAYGFHSKGEKSIKIFNEMIMFGRCGRLNEAYEFIKSMAVKPDHGVWGAMLSSCNYHGDVEMGKKVGEILFSLEPKNAGYYVSLANTYVGAGSWSDAVKLREFVDDVRLKKPAGCSLVDVG